MTTTPNGRVWLITGASRGLGHAFAAAALAVGDRVALLARTAAPLDELAEANPGRVLALTADITDRNAVFAAVDRAARYFGRLDVVVNNAGHMAMGAVEEFTEQQVREQFEVNFFGAMWVTQAVLPVLREQRSGHIVQISSIGGVLSGPTSGIYSASKFALEGMSEALAAEVAGFDVKVSIVEPGGYWTEMYNSLRMAEPLDDYGPMRAELERQWAEGSVDSEPALAAEALLRLVGSEEPPLRLLLGSMIYDLAMDHTRKRMDAWAGWEDVSRAAEQAVDRPADALAE